MKIIFSIVKLKNMRLRQVSDFIYFKAMIFGFFLKNVFFFGKGLQYGNFSPIVAANSIHCRGLPNHQRIKKIIDKKIKNQ